MQTPLVMTVIGPDRTGLVESIARLVAEHGGNWLESRMCRLGGEFAGILRVNVPNGHRATLEIALNRLENLTVVVHPDMPPTARGSQHFALLEVVGQDRPGIVREITAALSRLGVNVEDFSSECVSAPMSGEPLFQARVKLLLPAGMGLGALRPALERAAAEIGVELTLQEIK
jgi:glycine cleavage system regulatory protein